jgi:hypothetical protein
MGYSVSAFSKVYSTLLTVLLKEDGNVNTILWDGRIQSDIGDNYIGYLFTPHLLLMS